MDVNLRVVYRSTGRENMTCRPPFYSKLLALKSFVAAVEHCSPRPECVFLNDGFIPEDRLELMRATGDVVEISAGSSVRAHVESIKQIEARDWPDGDIAYSVEDDYLHLPESLQRLVEVASAVPHASYFSLGDVTDWEDFQAFQVDGTVWRTMRTTTATFAARLGVLRADKLIHAKAYAADGGWDRDICLTYQGIRPYRWPTLVGDLLGNEPGPTAPGIRRVKRAAARTLLNFLALRRAFGRRLLIAPFPPLATHMAEPFMAPGVDWEEAAARVEEEWAGARVEAR